MPAYLSLGDVLALHREVMRRLGADATPLRDEGLLESAVMSPRMAAHYEGSDLIRQATLLAVGISQAQAFLDGNKRTAYLATVVFLLINDADFVGEPLEFARCLEHVAEQSEDRATAIGELEEWLRAYVVPSA
ncbi:MAG: type II toxin-antitoxin system death-on-curing family toxin [Chloroflexota bacterium]|nr:type II toxin-antitoxin system death-on-curing family toxin [Chloroflexota bacterium]